MAQLVGIFNVAHSPFCFLAPEKWEDVRSRRLDYRADLPVDDLETNIAKAKRIAVGMQTVREKIEAQKPDVLVVVGDDQNEQFDFDNHPAISLFIGESFSGRNPYTREPGRVEVTDDDKPKFLHVSGHPDLAIHLLTGLLALGFDPAFSVNLPKPDRGMCHAVMNPLTSVTDLSIPVVPLLLNAYYAPQLTAQRCYEVGRAVRRLIDSYPVNLRVAALGSGGLWHTPGQQGSWINEDFDRRGLELLARGDIRSWAAHFDAYQVPDDDLSQSEDRRGASGLPSPGGPQDGTRETCNWIGAAAMGEGCRHNIVDYVPVYASPFGAAFAWSTEIDS